MQTFGETIQRNAGQLGSCRNSWFGILLGLFLFGLDLIGLRLGQLGKLVFGHKGRAQTRL